MAFDFLTQYSVILTQRYNSFRHLQLDMEEITEQMKTLIHHILYRHKIYRLEMNHVQDVLCLLQQRSSQKPQQIQELIFRGIFQFSRVYGDNLGAALSQEKFSKISHQNKVLLHKVLHQFFFLNSIRAYEMFQPHFQQPALHSMGQKREVSNQILDDQFQKTKLHYMYYGPLSVYNFNQASQPYFNNMAQNTFTKFDPVLNITNQSIFNPQNVQNQPPKQRGRPPLNIPRPSALDEYPNVQMPVAKTKNSNRGRPPKVKKTIDERLNIQILQQQQVELRLNVMELEYEKQEQNRLLALDQCICKGLKKSGRINNCACKRRFHVDCSQDQNFCFSCKQLRADPFYRVISVIEQFSVNFQQNISFSGLLNLQPYKFIFQQGQKYQIMVSSARPFFSGVCWPDDILFSLNKRSVFQIPALLVSHSQLRRVDNFLNITPHLKELIQAGNSLKDINFRFQLKHYIQDEQKLRRNNRKGQFLINFFLVNSLTPSYLIKEIQQKNSNPNNFRLTNTNSSTLNTQKDCILQKQCLSLLDPFSRQLMDLPAKGSKCTHLRSFDLSNFINLMYNVDIRKWQCPYCHKDARDLVIDNFSLNLLKEMKRNQKISDKVIVYENGRVQYAQNDGQEMQQSERSNEH